MDAHHDDEEEVVVVRWSGSISSEAMARRVSANAWTVGMISSMWTIAVAAALRLGNGGGKTTKSDPRVFALIVLCFSVNQLLNFALSRFDMVMNLLIDQVVSRERRALTYFAAGCGGIVLFLHLPPNNIAVGLPLLFTGFAVQVAVVGAIGCGIWCRFN